ncbi:MAG: DUF6188 family protein [Pseudonocardiaceae bacterium]
MAMKLGLEGQSVTHETVDYAVTLNTNAGFEIRIETDFFLSTPEGNFDLSPDSSDTQAAQGRALLHQTVTSSVAEESGVLSLDFSNGLRLRVDPHDSYEAWTVAGPGGMKVVSMPGGELAVWSPEND